MFTFTTGELFVLFAPARVVRGDEPPQELQNAVALFYPHGVIVH
jgi:hypothetical protein